MLQKSAKLWLISCDAKKRMHFLPVILVSGLGNTWCQCAMMQHQQIEPCTKIIYCKYISRAPTTTATKFRVASFTIPNKKIRDDLLQKIIPHHFNARFFSAQQPNSIIYGALMTTMATPGSHSAWRRCVRCGLGEVKAKMASDLDDDLVGAETWKKGDTKKRCLPKRFLSKWSQKFSNGCKWLLTKWVRTYDYKQDIMYIYIYRVITH